MLILFPSASCYIGELFDTVTRQYTPMPILYYEYIPVPCIDAYISVNIIGIGLIHQCLMDQ